MKETIIAVGNGGYNLATDLIAANLFPDAGLIVCDTNEKDLEKNSANATERVLLLKFRGKVNSQKISFVDDVVEKTTDKVIVCATLGGMTGSKFAPLIALNAILKGKFVCSLFSMPYEFEGEQKTNRAINARMQLIASSNLAIQQNNDRLKEVGSLGLNDIDKPLVEAVKTAMSHMSLEGMAFSVNVDLQEYIPEKYRVKDIPLLWFRNDCIRGIQEEERKRIFDLW